MASDGTVKIDTDLDSSGLKSGMGKVGSTLGKLGSGTLGLAKKGFTVLAGAVTATATAMGAGAVIGMKYNSTMEQANAKFETLLGSADSAQKHIKELSDFAKATPFSMPGLADASTLLLTTGTDVENVMGILQQLGDVSLGNADQFNSLALAYSQVQSTGRLMGQELNQMINAGFNPLQVISEKTGKSMAELKEEMSKGAISAEDVAQAFQWATEEGGMFYGGLEKQSNTVAGLTESLKEQGEALLGSIVEPLSNEVKPIIKEAIGWIDELSTALEENGLEGMIEAGGSILADIITGLAQAAPGVIDTAVTILESLIQGLRDNSATITTAGMDILTALINGVVTLIPSLGGLVLDILGQIAASFLENSPKMVEEGKKALQNITKGISNNLPEMLKTAGEVIKTMLNGIIAMLPDVIDMGIELLLTLIDGVANTLPELIPMVVSIIQQIVTSLWDNFPKIIESGVNLILKLLQGVVNAVPGLVSYFPTIISSIIRAFSNTDWISVGKNLIGGIVSGVVQAAGNLVSAAVNAAKDAVNAVKGWLGIRSPSRLMRDLIGKNMIAGVTVGIDDETPNLIKDVKANMGNVVDEMQMEANKVSLENGITGTYKAISSDVSNTPITTNANFSGEIHTHVELDKKEVGISIAPVVAEELAFA